MIILDSVPYALAISRAEPDYPRGKCARLKAGTSGSGAAPLPTQRRYLSTPDPRRQQRAPGLKISWPRYSIGTSGEPSTLCSGTLGTAMVRFLMGFRFPAGFLPENAHPLQDELMRPNQPLPTEVYYQRRRRFFD